ncbi:MAG: RHS repeat-associated core domain-containing protein, partial [Anaerolineales bacterium]|nr:RHS repeat-associated core domain-containing protein [Anaerolineales bacterium]
YHARQTVIYSITYDPYGRLLAQTGSSGTTYGFTGEQEDAATGLMYLRARYYNPALKVFLSRDPFPGHIALPASQHGYSYAHNNSPNYIDPTGSCIFGGIDTAICLGAGLGFVSGYVGQVANNMHNGMSFFDAVYYKNINWTQVGASTVAGGVAGTTGFVVGGAAGGFAGGLLPPATTLAGAVGSGAVTGAVGGFVGGAAAGGAWQLTYNALTPCTTWDENVLRAIGGGAVTGGVFGGVLGGVSGGLSFRHGLGVSQDMFVHDVLGDTFQSFDDTVAYYLQRLPKPGTMTTVDKPISTELMAALHRASGDEFALLLVNDKMTLFHGSVGPFELPAGTTQVFAHTHPYAALSPSNSDLTALNVLNQSRSHVITETGRIFRFTRDGLYEEIYPPYLGLFDN